MKVLAALGLAVALLSGCGGSTTAQPAPTVSAPSLGVSDYGVIVNLTDRSCFYEAGCLNTIRLTLDVSSRAQGIAAEVTVTVKGDRSGPIIETIYIYEDGSYIPVDVDLSVRNSDGITAEVTDVRET